MKLAEQILNGNKRAAARLITLIEDGADQAEQELDEIFPHTGRAHILGITGPPGAGKSTLVRELARTFRARDDRVGIIAVDPTSPFTGGALLGDRVRMQEISTDPGVFIRSMATRGAAGGLAVATSDATTVLDALGCRLIIVETVGAGQGEVDIAKTAHTSIVVEVPGMGDDIQAIKAGIFEIADIFVVNKADKEGADRTVADLETLLSYNTDMRAWTPPIVKTIATAGQGIDDLAAAIDQHRAFLHDSGELQRRLHDHTQRELFELLKQGLLAKLLRQIPQNELQVTIQSILDKQTSPHVAANSLISRFRQA